MKIPYLKMKKMLVPWLFLAPSLGGAAVFMGGPFVDVVKRSFTDAMGGRFTGLQNYQAVVDNSAFQLAAGNTVRFLGVCIPLLMTISLGLALLIAGGAQAHKKSSVIKNCRTILVLPMAVPTASMVLVWRILLCPDGVLNQMLSQVTGKAWETDWAFSRHAFWVLIATYLWRHTGYDMLLWLAGLQGIPGEQYEAARMDGAGAAARFWYITIPGLKGTLGMVGVLSVVNSFRVYREAYLLAGSYPDASIYLIPHLFAHWFLGLDIQKMTAAAAMMTGVCLIPAGVVWIFYKRRRHWM